jgi:hypothetical protein
MVVGVREVEHSKELGSEKMRVRQRKDNNSGKNIPIRPNESLSFANCLTWGDVVTKQK